MGLIRRSYTYWDKNSFNYLFNALVRLHLEYCVSIWYPLLKIDEELIENVLRRASKLIPGISNFSYADGLRAIDIPRMKYRPIRGDIIKVYKIIHCEDKLLKQLFNISMFDITSITRRHKFKRKKPLVKNKVRTYLFSIRVINDWNSLPPGVANAV